MNIYDISEKAGVSIATVSRIINGSSKVSPKTRDKVMLIIDKYGYTPNAFARGLGKNTMNTIGILCADSSDPYLANAVYYVEQNLREKGYGSLLCCTGYDLENRKKYLKLLLSKRVDGVILVGSNFVQLDSSKNQYILEASLHVPVILLNGNLDGQNIYSTVCDDFQAICSVTSELITKRSSNILYLYDYLSYSGYKKLSGYKEAFLTNGVPLNENLIQFIKPNSGSLRAITDFIASIAAQGAKFDSVIAANDRLAIGALKYARSAGIKVPRDLSIIGYNNLDLAEYCDPELTSIDNKLKAICRQCVNTLTGVLSGREMPKKTVFAAELVKRGTTIF
jgi:LacI family transcriptional regulator/LacI family asc operon transcriptional repressor